MMDPPITSDPLNHPNITRLGSDTDAHVSQFLGLGPQDMHVDAPTSGRGSHSGSVGRRSCEGSIGGGSREGSVRPDGVDSDVDPTHVSETQNDSDTSEEDLSRPQSPHGTRIVVTLSNKGFITSSDVHRKVGQVFRSHPCLDGWCLQNVPKRVIKLWWRDWKKLCWWDRNLYKKSVVYNAFKKSLSKRYSDGLSSLRSPSRTKDEPKWVNDVILSEWKKMWDMPTYEALRLQNKKNRHAGDMKKKAEPTHVGGSISSSVHAARMVEAGEDPTPPKVFMRTHRRRDSSFVNERSRLIAERYQQFLEVADRGNDIANQYHAFRQAAGGVDSRRRILGLGVAAPDFYPDLFAFDMPRSRYDESSRDAAGPSSSHPAGLQRPIGLQATLDRLMTMYESIRDDQQRHQAQWEEWQQNLSRRSQHNEGINLQPSQAEINPHDEDNKYLRQLMRELKETVEYLTQEIATLKGSNISPSSNNNVDNS